VDTIIAKFVMNKAGVEYLLKLLTSKELITLEERQSFNQKPDDPAKCEFMYDLVRRKLERKDVFPDDSSIPVKTILDPIMQYCVERTVNADELATELMSNGLLTLEQHNTFMEKVRKFQKCDYLYGEVLIKIVGHKTHYEALFQALIVSGNEHIIGVLFEELRSFKYKLSEPSKSGRSTNDNSISLESQNLTSYNESKKLLHATSANEPSLDVACTTIQTRYDQVELVDNPIPNANPRYFVLQRQSLRRFVRIIISVLGIVCAAGVLISALVPAKITTHIHLDRSVELHEIEESTSRNQNTSHPTKTKIRIGAVTDFLNLPDSEEIYLTVNNSKGESWEHWFPLNGDKVVLLRLYKTFSIPEIRHFFSIMNKVTTLCIYNLNGKTCKKDFRKLSNETSIVSMESLTEKSETGVSSPRPKNIEYLTIGHPTESDLPESQEIHLNIYNSEGVSWESWFPKFANRVTLLRINGKFSPSDVKHFLFLMYNLHSLCVDKLIGKLC